MLSCNLYSQWLGLCVQHHSPAKQIWAWSIAWWVTGQHLAWGHFSWSLYGTNKCPMWHYIVLYKSWKWGFGVHGQWRSSLQKEMLAPSSNPGNNVHVPAWTSSSSFSWTQLGLIFHLVCNKKESPLLLCRARENLFCSWCQTARAAWL